MTNGQRGPAPHPNAASEQRRIGIVGCGRIGQLHASLLAREVAGLEVAAVADVDPLAAERVAALSGAQTRSIEHLLASDDVDAVAICSSTDSHADLVVAAAEAGKAIFCEKPVSLDLAEIDRALKAVESTDVPFMIGFNRRFDPGHQSVRDAVAQRIVGDLHVLRITSRDPAPPPPEYVATSGGIFLDMAIHDFDMAGYIVDSDVVEVYARGAVRVDPRIGAAGDVDTAVTLLTHEDGTLTTIDNSRQAVYGYDQRVEAFGSAGMAVSDNPTRHAGWVRTHHATTAQPLPWFFLERYRESYRHEWSAFHRYLVAGGDSPAGIAAARQSTRLALAATLSLREGRSVRVDEVG